MWANLILFITSFDRLLSESFQKKMDVFDFVEHFFYRLSGSNSYSSPIQIELQPGSHCDLYRCPHCYGFGQKTMRGETATAAEIVSAIDDLAPARPTIILSGVTTEPLTHPDAAGLIRNIRTRGLPLGLYTKGRRLDKSIRSALIEGDSETFVVLSIDESSADEYGFRHGIDPVKREGLNGAIGSDYFKIVLNNLIELKRERDAIASRTHIRAAFLLFADNSAENFIRKAIDIFGPHVDLLRFAIPQQRNDGAPPGLLPEQPAKILDQLAQTFASDPKVRIMTGSYDSHRTGTFRLCRAQKYQLTIDRAGNVFPCSEVAVRPYAHLSYGNIRKYRLSELLKSEARMRLFKMDIDSEMLCRVCNRRDEMINTTLDRLSATFDEGRVASPLVIV